MRSKVLTGIALVVGLVLLSRLDAAQFQQLLHQLGQVVQFDIDPVQKGLGGGGIVGDRRFQRLHQQLDRGQRCA